jgi:hypothetical protein
MYSEVRVSISLETWIHGALGQYQPTFQQSAVVMLSFQMVDTQPDHFEIFGSF